MAGHFYPLPPAFIGGRQPHAPRLGVAQSGPLPDSPPPLTRAVLGVLLASWVPAQYALPQAAKIAPLIPAAVAPASQPAPNRVNLSIIHAQWTYDPVTVVTLTSVASVLATPPQIDSPPPRTYAGLNVILRSWAVEQRLLPSSGRIAPLAPAPVAPDPPPVRTFTALNLIVSQWAAQFRMPPATRIAPLLAPDTTTGPPLNRAYLRIIPAAWADGQQPVLRPRHVAAILAPAPTVPSAPPQISYTTLNVILAQWIPPPLRLPALVVSQITEAPVVYTPASVTVRAHSRGYFGQQQRAVGDTFEITTPYEFSPYWMTLVDTPPSDWTALLEVLDETTDQEMLRQPAHTDDIPEPFRSLLS